MRRLVCALGLAGLCFGAAAMPSVVRAHGIGPGGIVTGALSWADPAPGGIGYEWTLIMNPGETTSLVGVVSAKSWNEPMNPENLKGWTHTSNWVAFELERPARVRITVEAQQGVVYTADGITTVARYGLVPALSLYSGWDDTTSFEDHAYNNAGNFWSTVIYVGHNGNAKSRSKITYKAKLPAGRYSIAVGGNPASLGDASQYPSGDCDPVDPLCYRYSGNHGYLMKVVTR